MKPAPDAHKVAGAQVPHPSPWARRRPTQELTVCIKVTVTEIEGGKETVLASDWKHVNVGRHRREAEKKAKAVAHLAVNELTRDWQDLYPHRD